MIERHTFTQMMETVQIIEDGIAKFEEAINTQVDENWMTKAVEKIIHSMADGFTNNGKDASNCDVVEVIIELLYHFIYMENFGNDSEHCKSKLVIVNEGKDNEEHLSCTNVNELYDVIIRYITDTVSDFSFNYCHSYTDEKDELK